MCIVCNVVYYVMLHLVFMSRMIVQCIPRCCHVCLAWRGRSVTRQILRCASQYSTIVTSSSTRRGEFNMIVLKGVLCDLVISSVQRQYSEVSERYDR